MLVLKSFVDVPRHEYFSYLGQKTQMETANQTKIDVSGAKMKVIICHNFIHIFVNALVLICIPDSG